MDDYYPNTISSETLKPGEVPHMFIKQLLK